MWRSSVRCYFYVQSCYWFAASAQCSSSFFGVPTFSAFCCWVVKSQFSVFYCKIKCVFMRSANKPLCFYLYFTQHRNCFWLEVTPCTLNSRRLLRWSVVPSNGHSPLCSVWARDALPIPEKCPSPKDGCLAPSEGQKMHRNRFSAKHSKSVSLFFFLYLETRTLPLFLEIDGQISCLSIIIFIVWYLKMYTMSHQAQSLLRHFIN